jgi:hypothetical protein
VKNMADERNHDKRLERLMNQLAESVLGLTDEDVRTEASEAGTDPAREAKRTRLALQNAAGMFDSVSRRLSNLGHTINSNDWCSGESVYHNACQTCGLFVTFTTTTGEIRGEALDEACSSFGQYKTPRRKASC